MARPGDTTPRALVQNNHRHSGTSDGNPAAPAAYLMHDANRCVTCSVVQHRDAIADAWWIWGARYRRRAA